jgi:hypothetical protein
MAFNPFHAFRKHQKVVFAGLTILCMITFVFSSGSSSGDFFSQLERMFGGKGKDPVVATLYDHKVDTKEMLRLRQSRELANRFMSEAVEVARGNIIADVFKNIPEFDELYKSELRQLEGETRLMALKYGSLAPFLAQQYQTKLDDFLRRLGSLQSRLETAKKKEEADKIALLRTVLERDIWQLEHKDDLHPMQGLYFGGGLTVDGLLEFMIWQKMADRLGIQFTPEDIKREITRETNGLLTAEQSTLIQQRILNLDRYTSQQLLPALGEEFRVRLARATLSGFDSTGFIRPPAPITPYELWDYYLKNRTEATVELLPVPVSHFTSHVTEKPSEEALRELYDKYRDVEYTPEKDTPGFTLPRRVRVEWVEASPDSKYYRTLARNALISQVAASITNPWLAIGWLDHFMKEYERSHYEFDNAWHNYMIPPLTSSNYPLSLEAYASLNRPRTAAGILGQLGAAIAFVPVSGGIPEFSLLPVLTGFQARATAQEQKALEAAIANEGKRRIPLAVALFGAGGTLHPALAIAATYDYAGKPNQYLPFEVVRGQLIRQVEAELAGQFVNSDMAQFRKDLADVKNQTPAFVKKEVERRGWKYGSTKELRDRFDIGKDAGLDPLKDAYGRDRLDDPRGEQDFANRLFQDYDPKATLYKPEMLGGGRSPSGESQTYYYWKSVDLPPEPPLSYEAARPRVEEAWRLEKARPLAKAEAERIAEKARSVKGDAFRTLIEAAQATKEKVVRLPGVARVKPTPVARAGGAPQYEPYHGHLDKLPYIKGDFLDRVLDDMKAPGDVIVLSDQPEKTYYVATLIERAPPTKREYQDRALLGRLEYERRREYREQVRDALHAQAQLKIDEKVARSLDKAGSSGTPEDENQ